MRSSIRKKFMSVLLTLAMVVSLLPTVTPAARAEYTATDTMTSLYNSGSDAAYGDCYSISDKTELEYLSTYVGNGYNTSGVTFYLTDDIVLGYWQDNGDGIVDDGEIYDSASGGTAYAASNWTPIGNSTYQFTGTFDGDGHTVSGVYINRSSFDYQGLFGYIIYATVQNVGVVNSFIKGNYNVGGVVGYNQLSTMRYCYNTGSITGTGYAVGGVVGINSGTVWYGYNTGRVTGNYDEVGGVVGTNSGTVQYSYNTGDVTSSSNYVGGVAGVNGGTVQYSYNTGGITGNTDVGGVAGANSGTVQYSYNTGNVTGGSSYVGGVAGESVGTITDCYYNSENCTTVYGIGNDGGSSDVTGSAVGKATTDMQGEALKTGDSGYSGDGWTTAHWAFAFGAYPQHTGTTADTAYEISTAAQLTYLAEQVNGGTDFGGIYFKQTADINLNEGVTFAFDADTGLVEVSNGGNTFWLGTGAKGDGSGENTTFDTAASTAGTVYNDDASIATGTATFELNEWTPIGDSTGFSGIFNGSNHKISGIYINGTSDVIGLFGALRADATIENVTVAQSYIKGAWGTGGVAGGSSGTIQNCCNTSTVIGSNNVGGVAGGNYGMVLSCCNTGAVAGSGENVGGVAGYSSGTIQYSYNTGAVTGSNDKVGGVTGYNINDGGTAATVQYCYNTGNVDGKYVAGGVVGYNDSGTVQYSYNTGAVTVSGNNYSGIAGGVAGYNKSGTVRYCYNAGSVYDYSGSSAGGVVANNNSGTVGNCFYDKQICQYLGTSAGDTAGTVGKSTSEMVGTGLSALLGTAENWVFTEEQDIEANLYPRLSGMESTNAAMLSASPAFLAGSETSAMVVSNFNVSTANGVAWSSLNEGIISVSNGAATIEGSGTVNLKASITDGGSAISRTVILNVHLPSNDARLASDDDYYSLVKGEKVTELGTPGNTLASVTAGAVTITPAQAADTAGYNYSTWFCPTDFNASVKAVKYASGADTSGFENADEYDDEAISDGDFFIVRVTAEDQVTVNYYKIVVTVKIPAYAYLITGSAGSYNFYCSENGGEFIYIGNSVYIGEAIEYIQYQVGDGSATIWFGETGSDVSGENAVAGTLSLASGEYLYLGSSGTYTLKGSLCGSYSDWYGMLTLGGASAVVDGAALSNTGTGCAIYNDGSGTVSVSGSLWDADTGTGTYICSNGNYGAIYLYGSGTLNISGGTVSAESYTVSAGGWGANVNISGGRIEAGDGCALCLWGGTFRITGGTITSASTQTDPDNWSCGTIFNGDCDGVSSLLYISGGTIENTASGYPAIYNYYSASGEAAEVYLSGTPSISGTADVWTNVPIFANDGAGNYYGGTALDVEYGGTIGDDGTTVAVSGVVGNSSKFTCANTGYAFTPDGTDLVMDTIDTTYDYVITGTSGSYNVYYSVQGEDSFSVLGGSPYSTVDAAVSAVTGAVGSGSATLYFGETMTGSTASTVSGTLDIGSEDVDLGSSGTYTLKGSLTSSANTNTLNLEGASAVVDGATLENTNIDDGEDGGGTTLRNYGAGGITVLSGTVTSLGGNAISCTNESGSSGAITITGGTLTGNGAGLATIFLGDSANADASLTVTGGSIIHAGNGSAVTNEGTGEIHISGGTLKLSNYSGQSAALVVSSSCTVNISGNALLDNDGPGAAIGIFPSNSSTISPVINITGGHVKSTQAGYAIYSYDYFTAGTVNISGGTVENTGTGDAVFNGAGYIKISGGTVSGGTGRYGVYNASNGRVYLSLTPSITGGAAGLYAAAESTVVANDGETSPAYYSGAAVSVYYGGTITADSTVAVSGVEGNSSKFTCANTGYDFTLDSTDLVISEASSGSNDSDDIPATPSRTITVDEITAGVFKDMDSSLFGAKANMNNAFSNSVEVKITDSEDADTSTFKLAGANGEVYPFDISLYIKGTKTKTQPADGYSVTITLPLPEALWNDLDSLSIAHLNDGVLTMLDSTVEQVNGVWCIVFETDSFSPYALIVNDTWVNPYGDVTETDWFYDAVKYVAEKGLMNGTGDGAFSPGIDTSRAMIVTILWRMEGEPGAAGSGTFQDAAGGMWYTEAVEWAAENGIVTGYDTGNYGPGDVVTREQMAAILYRYARYKGYDVGVGEETNILSYEDALSVSEYAVSAMQWACGAGLLEGSGGSLDPQGGATRAQLAAVLMRFAENVVR